MEANVLGAYIKALENLEAPKSREDETSRLEHRVHLLEQFNRVNESRFRFEWIKSEEVTKDKDANNFLSTLFFSYLNASWSYLNQSSDVQKETLIGLHSRQVAGSLDSIRILSRDPEVIKLFENSKLLELIQKIANLLFLDEKIG